MKVGEEKIPVISEFLCIFTTEIAELSPIGAVEFIFDIIFRARLVFKSPY